MLNIEENFLDSYVNLQTLLSEHVNVSAHTDFLTFVRLVAPSLVSGWKMGRHIELISNKLKDLEEGKIKRLMVFLPPRSSKSVICSKLFPPAKYLSGEGPGVPYEGAVGPTKPGCKKLPAPPGPKPSS